MADAVQTLAPKKRWRKTKIAAVIVTGLILFAWMPHYTHVGEQWFTRRDQDYIEAGMPRDHLYRREGWRHREIDDDILYYQFYSPDCLIYARSTGDSVNHAAAWAVCGTHAPVIVGLDKQYRFGMDGLHYSEHVLDEKQHAVRKADGSYLYTDWFVPLANVLAVAREQPVLH